MKYALIMILSIFCLPAAAQSSLMDSSIVKLSGESVMLSQYSGRKLLVIILPTAHAVSDTVYIQKLASVCDHNSNRLVIIGVLSYEDGYRDSLSAVLKTWYSAYSRPNLLITAGMHTRKNTESAQNPLFKWLTDAGRNGHFDQDAGGVNQKFLIDQLGYLCGVYDARTGLSLRSIQKIMH
ncbi:MAG TPA: hypothetical protein VK563_00475 [Puia sp.]|nr:hypothetical protein [Puia sp.]